MKIRAVLLNAALFVLVLLIACGISELVIRLLYKDQTVLFSALSDRLPIWPIYDQRQLAEYRLLAHKCRRLLEIHHRRSRLSKQTDLHLCQACRRIPRPQHWRLADAWVRGRTEPNILRCAAALPAFSSDQCTSARRGGVRLEQCGRDGLPRERRLIKYKPVAVVLGFFGNDFEDNLKAGLFGLDKDGALTQLKYQYIPGVRIENIIYSLPGVSLARRKSYFYPCCST